MTGLQHFFDQRIEVAQFISSTMLRLLLAVFLGGLIGFERELRHKPAGLRTNTFICFGAALYTLLSARLGGNDSVRIAAQIIPGIGFIGAGSILHSRGGTTGLTTAATLFVVAGVGMAVGGGLYLVGIFATMVILVALNALGWVENNFNLKPHTVHYEVLGDKSDEITAEINDLVEDADCVMESIQVAKGRDHYRIKFTICATQAQQKSLLSQFHDSELLKTVHARRAPEHE